MSCVRFNKTLGVQFWELYSGKSLAEIWDGQEIKLNFIRNFSVNMMSRWIELVEIFSSVQLNQDGDALVWAYESSKIYSTQSLYAIVNFYGVQTVYILAI